MSAGAAIALALLGVAIGAAAAWFAVTQARRGSEIRGSLDLDAAAAREAKRAAAVAASEVTDHDDRPHSRPATVSELRAALDRAKLRRPK